MFFLAKDIATLKISDDPGHILQICMPYFANFIKGLQFEIFDHQSASKQFKMHWKL